MSFEAADLAVADLRFDLDNPRVPLAELTDSDQALIYLVETADVAEVVNSIALSGWIDIEPPIVLRSDHTVLEGNRRLAALRLIRNENLALSLGVTIPQPLSPLANPESIRCLLVDSRAEARDYIGFKHINGPYKWDAFAKAKYAADWLNDGEDVQAVAKRLGDGHNTVVRLVNGFRVYQQSLELGFERDSVPGRFSFSHLYTALTRPAYREYLGLDDATGLLGERPVNSSHREQLVEVMTWLFGQDDIRPVIRSQNPDLRRLAQVLPNGVARQVLRATVDLDEAYDIVADRKAEFSSALASLNQQARKTLSMVANFDGEQDLLELARGVVRTVQGIEAAMRASDIRESPTS